MQTLILALAHLAILFVAVWGFFFMRIHSVPLSVIDLLLAVVAGCAMVSMSKWREWAEGL